MSACDPTCTPETCNHYSPVSACVDCVFLLANGDVPEDRPNLQEEIFANWPGFDLMPGCSSDCCGEDGDRSWFSWSSCEVCGSSLGGDREHVTPFKV